MARIAGNIKQVLDLGFGDLIPGASGTPLEGVSIDGLTLMMVPPGKSLSPGDVSIPARIAGNIKQVLDDLASSQPDVLVRSLMLA